MKSPAGISITPPSSTGCASGTRKRGRRRNWSFGNALMRACGGSPRSAVERLPEAGEHAVPGELEFILRVVDVRLEVDDQHFGRGERLPAVDDHRRDLDESRLQAAEEQ